MRTEVNKCRQDKAESTAVALRLRAVSDLEPNMYYTTFLDLIKSLLDGNIESTYYEDQLREMFGIHAYIAFTMDKVVQNIVKQLQYTVSDDLCREITDIWIKESKNNSLGGPMPTQPQRLPFEATYQKLVESHLTDENCFRVFVEKKDLRMTISLLDVEHENSTTSSTVNQADQWSEYVGRFVAGECEGDLSDEVKEYIAQAGVRTPVFMKRNLKKWRKHNHAMLEKPGYRNSINQTAGKNTEESRTRDGDDDEDEDDEVAAATEGMEFMEKQACRFNLDSFKMVYVVNSETYLYKKRALTKARESHERVSAIMTERWNNFCKDWQDKNATVTETMRIQDWMEGRDLEDCRPCRTTCHRDNDVMRPPYHPYSRFSVRYERVTATVLSTVPDDGSITALSTAAEEAMELPT